MFSLTFAAGIPPMLGAEFTSMTVMENESRELLPIPSLTEMRILS